LKRAKSVFLLLTILLLTIQFNGISFSASGDPLPASGAKTDSENERSVADKFEPQLWDKVQALQANGTTTELSLIIRFARDQNDTARAT